MPWVAVDRNNGEYIYNKKPERGIHTWNEHFFFPGFFVLPKGSIKKLIGRELKWKNEPVELK